MAVRTIVGSMDSRILPLLLFLFAASAVASPLGDQRARFNQAFAAAKAGSPKTKALSAGLEKYALYPYLRYEALRRELPKLPAASVESFLNANRGSYIAAKLREDWLRELGQQHQWALYDRFYRTTAKLDLACIALRARLETGKLTALTEAARTLWLTSRATADSCSRVFEALYARGVLTDSLVRDRVWAALRENRPDFAAYLLGNYSAEPAVVSGLVEAIKRKPMDAATMPALVADNPRNRALLGYAVTFQAGHDADRASALWDTVGKAHEFSASSRATLLRTLALAAVTQNLPNELVLLDRVPDTGADELLERVRLRAALDTRQWERIKRWTSVRTPHPGNHLRLAYWHARALEETGDAESARAAFAEVATARDYYGFLASDRINAKYVVEGKPTTPLPREIKDLQALSGMQRAREFDQLGMPAESKREWLWTLEQLSRREVEVAAKLATAWGWYDRAIFALGKIESYADTEVRFPIVYKQRVLAASAKQELSPARIYSIIRGESAFVVDARSGAGALGLMQLMPATGTETARRNGVPFRGPTDLLNPETNIQLGAAYLRQIIKQFGGNFALAAAAYNAGPSRVKSWLPRSQCVPADLWVETIPFAETEGYVRRALFYAAIYEQRLGLPTTRLSSQLAWLSPEGARADKC